MPAKKSAKKAASANSKKAVKPNSALKQKSGKKKINGQYGKDVKEIPDYVPVPESVAADDIEISEEDLEFFSENKQFGNFLSSLDSKELTKNEAKLKKPRFPQPSKPKEPEPVDASSSDEEDYDYDEDALKAKEPASVDASSSDEEDYDYDEDVQVDMASSSGEDEVEEEEDDEVMDMDSDIMESENEEEELEEEDIDQAPARKKQRVQKYDSDEEADYEKVPRKVADEWAKKERPAKLPIKLPSGRIAQVEHESADEQVESASENEQEESASVEEQPPETEEKVEEEPAPKLTKKQYILSKKEELAKVASEIQENPEDNINQCKTLRNMYNDENLTVKKLALLTQLAVFRDIIPGYRIRQLTEKEEAVKVSKEVRKLRDYEKALLHHYELYLKDLEQLAKQKKKTDADESLALIAVRCLCELLTTKTHFNFRLNIMACVVTRMSTMRWNEIADTCCKAIINVFENDELGRTSLDAVIMITRMVKSKNYAVHENVINTFLHLRLRDELTPVASQASKDTEKQRGAKRKKQFLNKKARKTLKETKEIEKEFKEAEAVVDKEEKEKHHTETLKLIFAFYFRILKKQMTSPLLPAVLHGLAKFAHLINVDFFDDLLNALKTVLDTLDGKSNHENTRKRLLCVITAFELLSGQAATLDYDLKDYYGQVYSMLFEAAFHSMMEETPNSEQASESEMLLRCLELMFIKKRKVPIDRIAAFIKRFCIVSLNMPSKTAANCLQIIQRLMAKEHRLDALTQSEDRAVSGVYMPYLQDPDLCNPFGTSLYELFLLKDHYDPSVRAIAQLIQQPPETS